MTKIESGVQSKLFEIFILYIHLNRNIMRTLTQERVSSKHSVDLVQFVSDLKNNNINNSTVTFLITGLSQKNIGKNLCL